METLTFYSDSHENMEILKAAAKALQISFEINEKACNPEFVAKIQESKKEFKNGLYKNIAIENIWK